MNQIDKPNKKKDDVVNSFTLFFIGVTAGFISAVFPRILPLVSQPGLLENIEIFNSDYIIVCVVFSILIGLTVFWIYSGSTNSPRQLFFAALGVPALLSGGLNMNDAYTKSITNLNQEQAKLTNKNNQLLNQLNKYENIIIDDSEEIDLNSNNLMKHQSTEPSYEFSLITSAYAQGLAEQKQNTNFDPGVKFKDLLPKNKYIMVIKSSPDSSVIEASLKTYRDSLHIDSLQIIKSKDNFYIIKGEQMTKTDAFLNAINLRNNYHIDSKLIKVKSK